MSEYRDELRALAMPVVVLALAGLAVLVSSKLPAPFATFGTLGPFPVLVIGAAISLWFNRGRPFITLVSLLIGFSAYYLSIGFNSGPDRFPAQAVWAAVAIFVPANVLLVIILPERGVVFFRNYRWLLLGAMEILVMAWIATAGRSALSGTAWHGALEHWLLRPAPMPLLGRLLIAAAFALALARAWRHRQPLDVGMTGALIAFFVACLWPERPLIYGLFMFAAGAILLLALLQESHRLAFRDELTGLPSRRALQEKLHGLGPAYTIAMVDVDHFKQFNDTHGHDIGDQVLKLVGARLAAIGGGKAFRYGGEEFAVVFPDRRLDDALPELDALRKTIEEYKMAVRSTRERRVDARRKGDRRSASQSTLALTFPDMPPLRSNRPELLSVTVSIGAAQRGELLETPEAVIRAADEALYRAKGAGRNRVSV